MASVELDGKTENSRVFVREDGGEYSMRVERDGSPIMAMTTEDSSRSVGNIMANVRTYARRTPKRTKVMDLLVQKEDFSSLS